MKTYAPIATAILAASLAAPRVFAQHAQAELDRMPIFGMPAGGVERRATGSYTEFPSGRSLGIEVQNLADSRTGALKRRGVEVTQVEAGSPAAKAGFKIGDIVLDYNGRAVDNKAQFSRLVNETDAGRQVKIGVWRAGAGLTLTATVEAFEPPPDSFPTLVAKVEPQFTQQARKAGIEGAVSVYAEIGTDGRVYRARVEGGLGYGLDAKALEAVAQWRFSPGMKNGVPVIVPATIEVYFRRQR